MAKRMGPSTGCRPRPCHAPATPRAPYGGRCLTLGARSELRVRFSQIKVSPLMTEDKLGNDVQDSIQVMSFFPMTL